MRLTRLLFLAIATCACQQTTRPDAPPAAASKETDALENDPDYRRGLSDVLAAAPSEKASKLLRPVYALGYLAGQTDGEQVMEKHADTFRFMGCIATLPRLLEAGVTAQPEICKRLERAEYRGAKMPGNAYALYRLDSVEGVQGHPEIAPLVAGAFDHGYEIAAELTTSSAGKISGWIEQGCRHSFDTHHVTTSVDSICRQIVTETIDRYDEAKQRIREQKAAD